MDDDDGDDNNEIDLRRYSKGKKHQIIKILNMCACECVWLCMFTHVLISILEAGEMMSHWFQGKRTKIELGWMKQASVHANKI